MSAEYGSNASCEAPRPQEGSGPAPAMAWGKKDLPAMLKYLSQAR